MIAAIGDKKGESLKRDFTDARLSLDKRGALLEAGSVTTEFLDHKEAEKEPV